MSHDGLYLTISGADAEEFFERFDKMARRFGYAPKQESSFDTLASLAPEDDESSKGDLDTDGHSKTETVDNGWQWKDLETVFSPTPKKKRGRPPKNNSGVPLPLVSAASEKPSEEQFEPFPVTEVDHVASDGTYPLSAHQPETIAEPAQLDSDPYGFQLLTIHDVKMAAARLVQASKGDPAPLRDLLATYGLTRITPLPEDKWAEFISECDKGELPK